MHAYRILLPSETDDNRFNSREKLTLTDSVQPYNKLIIDLACSVCTVKYQTSVFCMKKPQSDISQYRPHARSISRYYTSNNILLSKWKETTFYALASNDSIMLEYPKGKFLQSFGDRSFTVAAPKLWNELPKEIRDISSISVFKTCLKTHIFKLTFNI